MSGRELAEAGLAEMVDLKMLAQLTEKRSLRLHQPAKTRRKGPRPTIEHAMRAERGVYRQELDAMSRGEACGGMTYDGTCPLPYGHRGPCPGVTA